MQSKKYLTILLGLFSISAAQAKQFNHLVSDTKFSSHINFELRNSFIGSGGNVEGTYNGETVSSDLGPVYFGCPKYIHFRLIENVLTYDLLPEDMKNFEKNVADACVAKYAQQAIVTFSHQLKSQKHNLQSYSLQ